MIKVKILRTVSQSAHQEHLENYLNAGWALTHFTATNHGFYSVLEREEDRNDV